MKSLNFIAKLFDLDKTKQKINTFVFQTRTAEDFVYEDFDVSSWFSKYFHVFKSLCLIISCILFLDESEKDFPRIKLKYIKELGKGWFGKVIISKFGQ